MLTLICAIAFSLWHVSSPLQVATPADLLKSDAIAARNITIRSPTTSSDESDYGSHLDPNGRT